MSQLLHLDCILGHVVMTDNLSLHYNLLTILLYILLSNNL